MKDKHLARSIGGLGCFLFAFYGFEHHYDYMGWLIFLGVIMLLGVLDD